MGRQQPAPKQECHPEQREDLSERIFALLRMPQSCDGIGKRTHNRMFRFSLPYRAYLLKKVSQSAKH